MSVPRIRTSFHSYAPCCGSEPQGTHREHRSTWQGREGYCTSLRLGKGPTRKLVEDMKNKYLTHKRNLGIAQTPCCPLSCTNRKPRGTSSSVLPGGAEVSGVQFGMRMRFVHDS